MLDKVFHTKIGLQLAAIFPVAFLAILLKFTVLSGKFQGDAQAILNMSLNMSLGGFDIKGRILGDTANYAGDSYFAATIFRSINIFGIDSVFGWSILLGVIFSIITFLFLIRGLEKVSTIQYIFILLGVAMLNIYVFTIGKDILQFIIFIGICLLASSHRIKSTTIKCIGIILIALLTALFLRGYFIVLAGLFSVVYLLFKNAQSNKGIFLGKYKLLILPLILFTTILLINILLPDEYTKLSTLRSGYRYLEQYDTNTLIRDIFENSNWIMYALNYVIVVIRLLLPIELLFGGIYYWPFVLYQLIVTVSLIKAATDVTRDKILYFCVAIAFYLTAGFMEPDFGSFARHSVTIFIILLPIITQYANKDKKCERLEATASLSSPICAAAGRRNGAKHEITN